MNTLEFIEKLKRLNKYITQERTGTPDEMADRLRISRSTMYEIIGKLRLDYDIDIKYSRRQRIFYYNNDTFLDIQICIKSLTEIDDPDELKNINGGCKIFSYLFTPQNHRFRFFI